MIGCANCAARLAAAEAGYRQRRNVKRKAQRHAELGMVSREEYRARALRNTRPWLAAGFNSERTWRRHGAPWPDGVPRPAHDGGKRRRPRSSLH